LASEAIRRSLYDGLVAISEGCCEHQKHRKCESRSKITNGRK
jgi:hypothetical protein